MSGTEIVYDNGNIDDAMKSFPPTRSVLRDTFVAVFGGPEGSAHHTSTRGAERGNYRTDLASEFPDVASVPACFEACAKFIPLDSDKEDVMQASGPGTATMGAQQESEALDGQDAQELVQWIIPPCT
eukprot:12426800-Karenia_brevis.AAC.1